MTSGGVFFLVRQTISLRFLHQNRMIVSDSFFRRARPFRDWPRASERSPHAPFGSRSIPSGSDRICRFIHGRKLTVRDIHFLLGLGRSTVIELGEIHRLVRYKKIRKRSHGDKLLWIRNGSSNLLFRLTVLAAHI